MSISVKQSRLAGRGIEQSGDIGQFTEPPT